MKTTWSAARGTGGSGPHPVGPTITSGHGPGSESRTRPKARTSRSTFLRGSSVLTVSRNSPATPTFRRSASVAGGIGSGQVVGAAAAPPSSGCRRRPSPPGRPPPAGTGRRVRPPTGWPGAVPPRASARPRRVVASGCRRQATSCTVTTSRSGLARRSRGEASETEWTMSNPAGARGQPVVPGPGQEPARAAATCARGRPNAASGSAAPRRCAGWPGASRRPRRPPSAATARPPSRPRA